jgi:hypothetical protein
MPNILGGKQILVMLEMCIDAEERCDQRIAAAREANDFKTAAYQIQLKEQYENLKINLIAEIRGEMPDFDDAHGFEEIIRRLRKAATEDGQM